MQCEALVADDDLTSCLLLRSIIASSGMSCDVVHTGCDAVNAVANQDYVVAFIDLIMPEQNGDEAAARIHSMKSGRSPPVLVGIISYENADQRNRCLAAGMSEVIAKPICREAVRSILRRTQDAALEIQNQQA